jgi:hypothetical protein
MNKLLRICLGLAMSAVSAQAAEPVAPPPPDAGAAASPTLVSLHVKDAPLQQVLDELGRQMKANIYTSSTAGRDYPRAAAPAPPVSLDMDAQPFWVVMREVCRQTGWGPSEFLGSSPDMLLAPDADFAKQPFILSGRFLVTFSKGTRRTVTDRTDPTRITEGFTLPMRLIAEPPLRILHVAPSGIVASVLDETDNPQKANAVLLSTSTSRPGPVCNVSVFLRGMQPGAKRLAELRGAVNIIQQNAWEDWSITDALKASDVAHEVPGGQGKIVFRNLVHNGNQYRVHFSAELPQIAIGGPAAPPVTSGAILENGVRVLDASGWPTYWPRLGGASGSSAEFVLYPSVPAGEVPAIEPAMVVMRVPTAVQELAVSFEFKDLPLP